MTPTNSIKLIALFLSVSLVTGGCYSSMSVPVTNLSDLDLKSQGQDKSYLIEKKNGEKTPKLESIHAEGETLIGQLKQGRNQESVNVPFSEVEKIKLREERPGLSLLALLGGVFVVGVGGFFLALSQANFGQ